MADICTIATLSQTQIESMCSKATSVTPTIIVFILTLLFFTIFGLVFVKKNNRGTLALILVLTTLFSAAVMTWLLLSPHLVNNITGWFMNIK